MLITLTTDFGYQDPFVGVMKGVIFGINPHADVIDLNHGISPQDVMAAAISLRHSVRYFPQGTIHVAIVDPGVGGERRPLLIESAGNYFIGPDNGVFSFALEDQQPDRIICLSDSKYHLQPTSMTFHGRDIFAPVAAHLSLGVPAKEFGESAESFRRLLWPKVVRQTNCLKGEIVYVDGFGNLFTNIGKEDLREFPSEKLSVTVGTIEITGLAPNYAAGTGGGYIALFNSWDFLEISLYKDNAQRRSQAKPGDKVYVWFNR
jgi:S-adenosyl-L-methionine hydrolase (adenosine-forming)